MQTMTPEQKALFRQAVAYAVGTQFGEVPRRVNAITNVLAMHIEEYLLNEKVIKK